MPHITGHNSPVTLPGLSEAQFSDPRERAIFHLSQRGVLIVDDQLSQIRALHDVCADFLEIPERHIKVVHVNQAHTLNEVATTLERALRDHLEAIGNPFASIITDYNFSPQINSIDVWKIVESNLTDARTHQSWLATGRVLVTASDRDSLIIDAQQSGLIDVYMHKPLKLAAFSAALCDSVLKRLT